MTTAAIRGLLELLASRRLDGVLISSSHNRRYFSAFTAEDHAPDESSGVLLVGPGVAELFTSPVNAAWARAETSAFQVRRWDRPWEKSIADRIGELGWRRVGCEDRVLPIASHKRLSEASTKLEWIPLEQGVDGLRARKSDEELDALATAIRMTDVVFARVAASIEPGQTESEIAWRIERVTREETGGAVAFPPIVASGPHAARPHHAATGRRIRESEPIIIDMGVAYRGYNGDLTRTICLGAPCERLSEVYNAVAAAQSATLAVIRPGQAVKDVDQAARNSLEAAGYGDHLVHSVGHGVGMRVHEAPSVSIKSDEVLAAGNVITIEPGVYIEGWGGVRIEDIVAVTDSGYRMLTAAGKQNI